MILFDVNEKGYTVEWTDLPYEVLYIVYYPVGARIMIENGRIVVLSKGFAYPSIVSPKKFGAITDRHAANIPSGTYSVRLCTDQKGAGGGCEILAERRTGMMTGLRGCSFLRTATSRPIISGSRTEFQ